MRTAIHRTLAVLLLAALLAGAPAPAAAEVTLTYSNCIFTLTFKMQLQGGSATEAQQVRLRILSAANDCFGGKKIGECCVLHVNADVVVGGAPMADHDQVQLTPAGRRARSKLGTLNGGSGAGEWPVNIDEAAIGASLAFMAGIRPEIIQEQVTKPFPPYPPAWTPVPNYPPCREGSKLYRSRGRIHKFHIEQLLSASGLSCPQSCCPQDQGHAGGSGSSDYSEEGGDEPRIPFAAVGPIQRPGLGSVNIRASFGPNQFYMDYTHPPEVGGGFSFAPAQGGTFLMQVMATPDPWFNPVLDPEEAPFMFTEFEFSVDPMDLEPGLSSGPNHLSLPDIELVESGLVSPSYGYLVDKQAPGAKPGVLDGASDDPDGWINGYMGIKWVNDVWTESAPAYFDVPIGGQLNYDTGSGFFGMFGGLVYMLDPTGLNLDTGGRGFALAPAFPNPFSFRTYVRFRVDEPSRVSLRVVDVAGRLVRTLVEDAAATPGTYHKLWDARDDRGAAVGPGVYFAVLVVDGERTSRRMVVTP